MSDEQKPKSVKSGAREVSIALLMGLGYVVYEATQIDPVQTLQIIIVPVIGVFAATFLGDKAIKQGGLTFRKERDHERP